MIRTNTLKLTEQLCHAQQYVLSLCQKECSEDFMVQYHPDLSPVGWHLGHCMYTEIFWIRKKLYLKMFFALFLFQSHLMLYL